MSSSSGQSAIKSDVPRSHNFPRQSQLSMASTSMLNKRSESRADSISTLWSSADIPLFLDSTVAGRESLESVAARSLSRKTITMNNPHFVISHPSSSSALDDRYQYQEEEVLAGEPESMSSTTSSPSSDQASSSSPESRSSKRKAASHRPSPLTLTPFNRDIMSSGIPCSVSYGSHLTSTGPSPTSVKSDSTIGRPLRTTPHGLYTEAEKYFSSTYNMSSSPSSVRLITNAAEISSKFSDGSPDIIVSPTFAPSNGSRSSTEYSTLPEMDDRTSPYALSPSESGKTMDSAQSRPAPVKNLFMHASIQRRPSTSDAAHTTLTESFSSNPSLHHNYMVSDQEMLRMLKGLPVETTAEGRFTFLGKPAPPRKSSLFGSRLRSTSFSKLRGGKSPEKELTSFSWNERRREELDKPSPLPQNNRSRSKTVAGMDRPAESDYLCSSPFHGTPLRPLRRPSSTEALTAAQRYLRRPSRADTMSSSHHSSSVGSLPPQSDALMKSPLDGNKSHIAAGEAGYRSLSSSFARKPPQRVSSAGALRPKSKGGWASHLSQGLTLHIEHGSKKYVIRMNYLSYDPFGKPESLCDAEDRPTTPGSRPKSKSGQVDLSDDSVGLLEFAPCPEMSEGVGTAPLVLSSSSEAVILKHLMVGSDSKGDLITRQANLSMCNIGTREVSGCERKGKVTWRFVYGVEECRHASGRVMEGIKTLRPLSFFCSATLLDPSRARKGRMLNIIKKQIGSHIESTQMAITSPLQESSTASSTAPSVSGPQVGVQSPTTVGPCSDDKRAASTSSQASHPFASPAPLSRPGLVPFKLTRPMLDALAARDRLSGELSTSSSSMGPSSPMGGSSHITRKSSVLASPLSSHFPSPGTAPASRSPAAKSARELTGDCLLAPQPAPDRVRRGSVGYGTVDQGALGLHGVHRPSNQGSAGRSRAVTTHADLRRPPTASEEIKQAYLSQASQSEKRVAILTTTQQNDWISKFPTTHTMHSSRGQKIDQATRAVDARRPSTTQVDTRESGGPPPFSLFSSKASKRQTQAPLAHNTPTNFTPSVARFQAPEGPYWL